MNYLSFLLNLLSKKVTLLLSLTCMLFVYNTHNSYAQCTIATVHNSGLPTGTSANFSQTFKATCDGTLQSIGLYVETVLSTQNRTLEIYSGTGTDGSKLGEVTLSISSASPSNGYTAFDFSSEGISLINNQVYTFHFNSNTNIKFGINTTDAYNDGDAYIEGSSGGGPDFIFQIQIGGGNTAPTASSFTAADGPYEGLEYIFETSDFGYSDTDTDPLDHIKIKTIPSNGTLYLDANNSDTLDTGEAITANTNISKANLDAGNLQYIQTGSTNTSFTFEVNDGTDYSATDYTATLNVVAEPTVTLAIAPTSRTEGTNTNNTITATLSHSFGADITVDLAYSGTATGGGTDYSISGNSITISSGDTEGTATISNVNDVLDEADETVIVDIDDLNYGSEGSPSQATFTIEDDDDAPTVTLIQRTTEITDESGGEVFLIAQLSAVSDKDITVNIGFSGTATGSGTDYTTTSNNITISKGDEADSLRITSKFDATEEGDETIIADINSVTNGTENGAQQVTFTIIDEDATNPIPTISSSADDTTNLASIPVSVSFNENVVGFSSGDLSVVGGSVSGFTGSDDSYSFNITPSGDGQITVNILENKAADAFGNGNTAATEFDIVSDRTAPTVVFNDETVHSYRPEIGGTINDPKATIAVSVNGQNLTGVNNGNGTWVLPTANYTADLPQDTLDVSVIPTDRHGNIGDTEVGEIIIIVQTTWDGTEWSHGEPDENVDLIIDNDTQLPSSLSCKNIIINSGKTLTISEGNTLIINGSYTNDGNGFAGKGKVKFTSDTETIAFTKPTNFYGILEIEEGTSVESNGNIILTDGATLLHSNADDIVGDVQATRVGSTSGELAYNYWSVPFEEGTEVSEVGGNYRYTYDEPTSSWISAPSDLQKGRGMIATGADNVTMSGTPFADSVKVKVTFQGPDATYKGYNLLGNPYLAGLDYDAFIADNNFIVDGTLYFYVGNPDGSGAYEEVNSSNKKDIPSFQSFFVAITADDSVAFYNDQKVSGTSENFFRKENSITEKFELILSNDQYRDQTRLVIGETFSNARDYGYDAHKMYGDQPLSIGFKGAVKDQSIVALGTAESYLLPLVMLTPKEGAVLTLKDNALLEQYEINLLDLNSDQKISLTEAGIKVPEVNVLANQYALEITPKATVLAIGNTSKQFESIFTTEGFALENLESGKTEIYVYDFAGKEVTTMVLNNQTSIKGNWQLNPSQLYLITVRNGGKVYHQKVIFDAK